MTRLILVHQHGQPSAVSRCLIKQRAEVRREHVEPPLGK